MTPLRLALAALLLSACSGPLTLNVGTLSAGVLMRECIVAWGYYDSTSGKNDSGEVVLCR